MSVLRFDSHLTATPVPHDAARCRSTLTKARISGVNARWCRSVRERGRVSRPPYSTVLPPLRNSEFSHPAWMASALRNDEVDRVAANGHFPGRHVLPRRSDGVLDLPPTRLCLSRWRRRVVARGKRDADRDPLVVVEVAQAVRRLKRGLWPATRRSTAGAARCGELERSV